MQFAVPDHTPNATLLGMGAVLLWSSLAALTAMAGAVPPFQLSAMTFAIGMGVGVGWARVRGQSLGVLRTVPLNALALGVYGLLFFHVCYFTALQNAPVLEASLIIYLWPLFIILFAGLLPARFGGLTLRSWHVMGALLGLAGTVVLLWNGNSLGRPAFAGGAGSGAISGYILAALAAVIWASYSVLSRLLTGVPSTAVIASCAVTALGSLALHWMLETTVWPVGATAWLAVLALGLGPVGLAFYLWDEAMKHGNMRLLGVASYATPLLSTLLLDLLGLSPATTRVWIAAVLIAAGAALAGWDVLRPASR